MPRGARLDAPNALHHVMARGIARQNIFNDERDCENFLDRVGGLVELGAFDVLAWALLPNHFHLLLKTRRVPLPHAMRSLLTGHAVWFNRRHNRVGHVFQNRYKSIVCEEEPYFLALVRYIHLNPLRAKIVGSMRELDTYPFSGHSAVLETFPRSWHDAARVLEMFGGSRRAYRTFIERAAKSVAPDLEGGGLRRSASQWMAVRHVRRGRECFTHDERVLGRPPFVRSLLRQLDRPPLYEPDCAITLTELIRLVCRAIGFSPRALVERRRSPSQGRAREGIAFLWISHLGRSGHEVAARLGIAPVSAYRCAKRGESAGDEWRRLLTSSKVTQSNNVPFQKP